MSGGTIATGNISRFLQEGIRKEFGDGYNEKPMIYTRIFDVKSSSKAYEIDVQLEGFGLAKPKPEGQSITYDSRIQGFTPKYKMSTYANGFVMTEEAIEDNLYNNGLDQASSLGRSMSVTKEIVHHNVLNRGFDTNYTMIDGDGQPLFSDSHPLGPTNTGTFSNVSSTAQAFSEASLEDTLIQIQKAVDPRGLPINLQAEMLIGAPENTFEFERVLGSVLQNDTANNAVNAVNSLSSIRQGSVTSVYLTSPDAWFIKTNCPNGLTSFNRRNITFGEDNSFDTGNGRYKATERYAQGWTDPRGIYGSEGTS